MFGVEEPGATGKCPACGTSLPPSLLACPSCGALVHAARLKRLAARADEAERSSDPKGALVAWREALSLLPESTRQAGTIRSKIEKLSESTPTSAPDPPGSVPSDPIEPGSSIWKKGAAGLSGLGLVLWKLKFAVVFLLSKAKLLLLGFTKAGSMLTMLLAFGVYWSAWGWKFALGFVLSIYVHEMGHVFELERLGFPASAPMFIPGVGAFVRLHMRPASPREDARIGLAGPVWGAAAALACAGVWLATGSGLWAAIAHIGAWINLFNLLPVWQLDGSRGFAALDRRQRIVVAISFAAAYAVTREGLLVLLALAAAVRCFEKEHGPGDRRALAEFVALIAVLSTISKFVAARP